MCVHCKDLTRPERRTIHAPHAIPSKKIALYMKEPVFLRLTGEAETRGIPLHSLIKAVIIPEWIRNQ